MVPVDLTNLVRPESVSMVKETVASSPFNCRVAPSALENVVTVMLLPFRSKVPAELVKVVAVNADASCKVPAPV